MVMTEPAPTPRTRASLGVLRDVLIVLVALALTLWVLIDDTLPAWLARLSIAGAIVAGLALTLAALQRLTGRP